MAERNHGAAGISSGEPLGDIRPDGEPHDRVEMWEHRPVDEADDPFEGWDRHPIDEADENIGYQRLAWFAAPFGDAALALLALAAIVNGLRRVGRAVIRLLMR